MRIISNKTLNVFRCGRWLERAEPHHAFARGMGAGSQLDHPLNLVACCGPGWWGVGCHRLIEDGHIPRSRVLSIIATREGMTVDAVECELFRLLRARKTR